ncbi:hypothetical protein PFJ02_18495 [Mycobacterium xenopi]|uniref:Uncharacterized protein n=1 Tax=Mycobacterium xenopi 4042 TaxID=1299334 RepID=X8BGL6_MYCXE|nr:hypothetical protein [Mycobacterium xenopi]EUA42353.1 hypothetical protein I553_6213 [Mycobacterium xenopi 4042]MDA3641777.1 hypothetical protein [Mycobacterium xenopi]MDA3664000.1 hypothetical protein [Mycobacterium xenopi]
MPEQVAGCSGAVRPAIRIGEAENLGVYAAIAGPITDRAQHRPGHAPLFAHLRDRRGFHVKRHHASVPQVGMNSRIDEQAVGGPQRAMSIAEAKRLGPVL